ncbi:MAG TPA: transketolase [Thermodesulfovibrionales bacterium]|nr:transketolase [Thermodesulfovibrionales bacterium]
MITIENLEKIAKLIRYYIISSTTVAGSGHPTSSLSATDLMTALFFSGLFRFHADHPEHPNNDRLIFSKGHASPLFYALWTVAGKITEQELMSMRKFGSPLEGHPTVTFPYTEAATGSLGQGLSIGVGMALNAKYIDKLPYRTFVLLGDSEMAEGSQWEAIQIAVHYQLDNLIGIIDVNRLGQRGETMYGHNLDAYRKRISSFGWKTMLVDGHSLEEIIDAYKKASRVRKKPVMIIAKTIKGKGFPFLEDKDGWHGKAPKKEEYERALLEFGTIDTSIREEIRKPLNREPEKIIPRKSSEISYPPDKPVATRKAYGTALARIFPAFPDIVVLDAEVSNSTFSEIFRAQYPERFFEMFIAEQNMVGAALGLSRRGKTPFISTFAAFFTRAFDQIRMSQYSGPNIKFCGSHAGVSIGEDGPSQMGLEDIAMFRAILNSVVLYPSDAVSTEKLVEEAAKYHGLVYIRTTRQDTTILYTNNDEFHIGGSKVLRKSDHDRITVIASGITLHEAVAASEELKREGISVRVIDLYSVKPIDTKTIREAAHETGVIITVEDHFAEGGIGEAVRSTLSTMPVPVHSLAVRRMPKSGKPGELLDYEEISRNAIARKVREVIEE